MKAFYRDGFVGVQAENFEEMELLTTLHRMANRGKVRVNGCSACDGGFGVALTVHPIYPSSEKTAPN